MEQREPLTLSHNTTANITPGSFGRRFVAAIIDLTITYIVIVFPSIGFALVAGALFDAEFTGESKTLIDWMYNIVCWVTGYIFIGYFCTKKGGPPGKLVMGLRILDHKSGKHISWWQVFLREYIAKVISALLFCIGYLMIIFRKDKRGLHDLIASTDVIRVE